MRKHVIIGLGLIALTAAGCGTNLRSPFGPPDTVPPPPVTRPVNPPSNPAPSNPGLPPGPPPAPSAPTPNSNGFETYSYVPGGESFGKWADDVTPPQGQTNCGRVWQATNLENLAWTAVFCNWKASNPAPKLQWPHATQLTTSGTGTVEFDVYRDLGAVDQLKARNLWNGSNDPYTVANAKQSPLGLGWFVQGFNGSVVIDGKPQDLSGGGVFQLDFPRDWRGHHHVVITVTGGQVQFWQGERRTDQNTWNAN